ncbi:hypothetical protein FOXB_15274 [Fusarium oxysporum f. sp. conglutinans Fo5176]|uniref:DUF7600 domain-containing protein n=1 Tax=Fusarium oxysporum (strain Fo5176) TaxID=660025 RepID=F9G9E2_FUSOF|nr:hypothetical protein FOXB_15274 [Fusarium oxysporum f. sp. conglutinans Fo5176]
MEEIDPCCCLCGIYIALTPSNRSRSLWLDQFYVVYTFDREANARAYLSTDGFRASRHHYIVVDPADYRFNDGRSIRVILMPYDCENPFRGPLPPGMLPEAWGYPFHAACWKILNTFGTVDQKDLQSILNLCHSAPKQLGMLNWGHDYRGQACHRLHVAPGEENFLTWSYRRDPDANPYSIVELTQIFDKLASNTFNNFTESEPLPKLHRFTVRDPFLRLPADILLELANHLTLTEVTLMKRSSRAFTNLSMFEPDAMPAELLDQKSWTNVSRTLSPPGKLFQRGCRFFYTRMLVLPSNLSAVYVSTIDIFERRYVSGLRFSDGSSKDFTIGFQHPRQEELLVQQATSIQIKGFDVAFDQHGVRGICILFGDGTQSYWAGEYENIPKRRVQGYAEEDTVTHLMGGFDAAKLVIIAINRDPPSWEPSMSTLWYPEIPTPDLLFPGLDATINNPFRPSSSVEQDLPACFALFPNGDLSKLRRIIVKHRVHSKDVLKIEYVNMASIDKSQSELGYRRAGERYSTEYDTNRIYVQSFLIDGPGGERIESFSTLWTHALVGFEWLDFGQPWKRTPVLRPWGLCFVDLASLDCEVHKVIFYYSSCESEATV